MIAKLLPLTIMLTLLICSSGYSDVWSFVPTLDILEEMQTQKWTPVTITGPKGLKAAAMNEGSDKRAEGDAEEWSYPLENPEELGQLIQNDNYYQTHPYGKAYLEFLLREAKNIKHQRMYPVFIIKKIGDRYFVYQFRKNLSE